MEIDPVLRKRFWNTMLAKRVGIEIVSSFPLTLLLAVILFSFLRPYYPTPFHTYSKRTTIKLTVLNGSVYWKKTAEMRMLRSMCSANRQARGSLILAPQDKMICLYIMYHNPPLCRTRVKIMSLLLSVRSDLLNITAVLSNEVIQEEG